MLNTCPVPMMPQGCLETFPVHFRIGIAELRHIAHCRVEASVWAAQDGQLRSSKLAATACSSRHGRNLIFLSKEANTPPPADQVRLHSIRVIAEAKISRWLAARDEINLLWMRAPSPALIDFFVKFSKSKNQCAAVTQDADHCHRSAADAG